MPGISIETVRVWRDAGRRATVRPDGLSYGAAQFGQTEDTRRLLRGKIDSGQRAAVSRFSAAARRRRSPFVPVVATLDPSRHHSVADEQRQT